jgi:hypothetical protein
LFILSLDIATVKSGMGIYGVDVKDGNGLWVMGYPSSDVGYAWHWTRLFPFLEQRQPCRDALPPF